MKKLRWLIAGMAAISLIFTACGSDDDSDDGPEVEEGKLIMPETPTDSIYVAASELAKTVDPDNKAYVLFFYADGKTDYSDRTAYLWVDNGTTCTTAMTTASSNGKTLGYLKFYDGTTALGGIPANVITTLDEGGSIKAIVKNLGDSWSWQTNDCSLTTATGDKHFLITSGAESKSENKTYSVSDSVTPMILAASSTAVNKIKVSINVGLGLTVSPSSNKFVVKDSNGAEISVIDGINYDNQNDRYKNNAQNILITLQSNMEASGTYYVSNELLKPDTGIVVTMTAVAKSVPTYDGDDLGITLDGSKATFKTWAPVASDVKLLLYSSVSDVGSFNADAVKSKTVGSLSDEELLGTPAQTLQMSKNKDNGVWSATVDSVSSYKYYKYQIVNSGTTYYVSDIWSYSASADAIASQIVDINIASEAIPSGYSADSSYGTTNAYYNPFNGKNSDAVVYEMHVTDWSNAEDNFDGNVGKYLTIANGSKAIAHIKSMGITHVQILPVFEFAETNENTGYNWGYNPYHYNVPEGRYVTEGYTDGTQAVKELRELIAAFHKEGIAVNMDVVYNHTNGTQGGSLYDSTVPSYFYRFDAEGNYSGGSGCGNEIDSEATMAKKYIIESLKHWMLDYHFNGFRFDLMGCLSKETMKEIYDELYKIDSSVMVYGEPWTGGTAMVVNGATQAVDSTPMGAGAFDDDFRDAIKGAEFGGFKQGQVQGSYSDSGVITGLVGKSGSNNRNATGKPGLSMHYVECHDNYTLFDKLAISYWQRTNNKTDTTSGDLFSKIGDSGLAEVKAEDTLSAAYVLLSQGTAFLNGGQEFLRTKRGNENSYNTSGITNKINISFADTYSDVCNVYRGLIALRQSDTKTFGGNTSASAETVSNGVTKYTTGDYLVYFNATDKDVSITTSGYTKVVDVTSGTPTDSTTLPTTVVAKSFVILKK